MGQDLRWQPFTDSAWDVFAGAERFTDTDPPALPLIDWDAEVHETEGAVPAVAILDHNGLSFNIVRKETGFDDAYVATPALAARWLASHREHDPKASDLLAAGFELFQY